MRRPVLGVDPGSRSGAAVLLAADGETVEDWTVWAWLRDGYRRREPDGPDRYMPHMLRVAASIAGACEGVLELEPYVRDGRPLVVIEGLFVPRDAEHSNPQGQLALAESVGEFRAGLGWYGEELRPLASVWRPAVLGRGCPRDKAGAEAYAVRMARTAFEWPATDVVLTKAEEGARAEAAWMARYGWAKQSRLARAR